MSPPELAGDPSLAADDPVAGAAACRRALAWYWDKLVLPGEHPGAIPGDDLLDGACRRAADGALRARPIPAATGAPLVSMWTQWHFGMLIIPTTAAILLLDRDLPIELGQVGVVPHEQGRTAALVIAHEGRPCGANADRVTRASSTAMSIR